MEVEKVKAAANRLGLTVAMLLYQDTDWESILKEINFTNGYRAVMKDALTFINKGVSTAISVQGPKIRSIFTKLEEGEHESMADNVIAFYGLTSPQMKAEPNYVSQTTRAADSILGVASQIVVPVKQQVIHILTDPETFTQVIMEMLINDVGFTIRNFKATYLSVINRKLMSIKKE